MAGCRFEFAPSSNARIFRILRAFRSPPQTMPKTVALLLVCLVVSLAALPFGSAEPFWGAVWCALLGVALLLWAGRLGSAVKVSDVDPFAVLRGRRLVRDRCVAVSAGRIVSVRWAGLGRGWSYPGRPSARSETRSLRRNSDCGHCAAPQPGYGIACGSCVWRRTKIYGENLPLGRSSGSALCGLQYLVRNNQPNHASLAGKNCVVEAYCARRATPSGKVINAYYLRVVSERASAHTPGWGFRSGGKAYSRPA